MEFGEIKKGLMLNQYNRGLQEYQLVVRPGKSLVEKIHAEKQRLFKKFEMGFPDSMQPCIVVSSFLAREEMEETLIRWIQRICSNQKGFQVTLNNYSGFPPHTIYLRVQDLRPFQQLATKLKAIDDFIAVLTDYIKKPHLSFESKLPEKIFEKVLFHYSQKKFHESFIVNELILLKKDRLALTNKPLNIFHFLPITRCI